MLDGYRIVCVTPAGRRRYLRLLIPYVLSCSKVDRYELWVNTPDPADIAFLEAAATIDDRITLVHLPDSVEPGPAAIRQMWPAWCESDTIYLRFDDDIVWIDERFFETFLSFRINNPHYFVVAPLIINNAMATYLLHTFRKIKVSKAVGPDRFDRVGWVNPSLARSLHILLQELITRDEVARLSCGQIPLSGNCFSINCISWFGRDLAMVGKQIPPGEDEEAAASCSFALRAGRLNCVTTTAVIAHFAFYTQREVLDRSALLEGYLELAGERTELEPWRSRVEAIYHEVERRYPVHLSLGGFKPLRHRRPWYSRLLRPNRSSDELPEVTVERGPAF